LNSKQLSQDNNDIEQLNHASPLPAHFFVGARTSRIRAVSIKPTLYTISIQS